MTSRGRATQSHYSPRRPLSRQTLLFHQVSEIRYRFIYSSITKKLTYLTLNLHIHFHTRSPPLPFLASYNSLHIKYRPYLIIYYITISQRPLRLCYLQHFSRSFLLGYFRLSPGTPADAVRRVLFVSHLTTTLHK